jgi:hypothetical protein
MESFLSQCLTKEYDGWRFFAHFGGRFDVHYVFDWIRANAPETQMEINCAGSCVIALTVRQGKMRWRFVDSYRLLNKSLASLTHEFDVKHKKLVGLEFTDRIYNEHDCRGLWEVLDIFFKEFSICSETIASHAMRVFRIHFMRREIYQPNRNIESFVRDSYFGGRCEIYNYKKSKVNHYDINSLYPTAMLHSVPVDYLYKSRDLPSDDERRIGFYHARIDYPDIDLPILPFRWKKLYFPVGQFEGNFSSLDLKAAIQQGAGVKIYSGIVFLAEPLMKEYAESMFAMKKQASIEGNGAKREISKKLMNSLYGKWGQRREQRAFIVDDGREGAFPLPNGLAYYMIDSFASHILPHISAAITSRARLIQHSLLSAAPQWYTDTDSLFTTAEYPVSEELGALHYEGSGTFQAYRLKEYVFEGEYKIKGLQRSKDPDKKKREAEDKALAEKYLAGEEIISERMVGFTESIRQGLPTVRRVQRKRIRNEIMEKRARDGKYGTRPWRANEIVELS